MSAIMVLLLEGDCSLMTKSAYAAAKPDTGSGPEGNAPNRSRWQARLCVDGMLTD